MRLARALVHEGKGLAFWNILKNAHTSLQVLLVDQLGFSPAQHTEVPDWYDQFVVLRDPVSRYWSGVYTCWTLDPRQTFEEHLTGVIAANRAGDFYTADGNDHLAPQAMSIPAFPRLTFFTVDRLDDLAGYLRRNGFDVGEMPRRNERPHSAKETTDGLVTPADNKIVERFYYDDLKLVRRANGA